MGIGTPTELNARALESLLRQYVTMSLHRGAAAALTVAFEIRSADLLSRGERQTDDMIMEDIKRIYHDMLAVTDPDTGLAVAKQAAMKKKPTP
jgi:hypothetical protein